MSIVARQGLSFKASFDQCYIFEDDNVNVENSLLEHKEPFYRVYDWMNVRTGTSHQFDFMETNDDLRRADIHDQARQHGQVSKELRGARPTDPNGMPRQPRRLPVRPLLAPRKTPQWPPCFHSLAA